MWLRSHVVAAAGDAHERLASELLIDLGRRQERRNVVRVGPLGYALRQPFELAHQVVGGVLLDRAFDRRVHVPRLHDEQRGVAAHMLVGTPRDSNLRDARWSLANNPESLGDGPESVIEIFETLVDATEQRLVLPTGKPLVQSSRS